MVNLHDSRKNKYHIIYKITNLVNQKIYIGAHSTNDINDGYFGSGKLLTQSIKKYGKDNFQKEILFTFLNPEDMFSKEKELVNEDFIKRNDVYNIVTGGFGGFNKGSKNLKHIKNIKTGKIIAVDKSKLSNFLSDEWVIGGNTPPNKGKVYVYKDDNRLAIYKKDLENYLNNGWNKGYKNSPTIGKIWIYLEKENKYTLCNVDEFEKYKELGWIKKKWAGVKKGTVWVNKEGIRKRILHEHLINFINQGWKQGKKI